MFLVIHRTMSALEQLSKFRYVSTARPVPWSLVRSVDVSKLRNEPPDLSSMKLLTSALSDCALDSFENTTAVEFSHLCRVIQAVMQFSLHSQHVLKEQIVSKQQMTTVQNVSLQHIRSLESRLDAAMKRIDNLQGERSNLEMKLREVEKKYIEAATQVKCLTDPQARAYNVPRPEKDSSRRQKRSSKHRDVEEFATHSDASSNKPVHNKPQYVDWASLAGILQHQTTATHGGSSAHHKQAAEFLMEQTSATVAALRQDFHAMEDRILQRGEQQTSIIELRLDEKIVALGLDHNTSIGRLAEQVQLIGVKVLSIESSVDQSLRKEVANLRREIHPAPSTVQPLSLEHHPQSSVPLLSAPCPALANSVVFSQNSTVDEILQLTAPQLGDTKTNMSNDSFCEIMCKHCRQQFFPCDIVEHESACDQRLLQCLDCKETTTARLLVAHKRDKCPARNARDRNQSIDSSTVSSFIRKGSSQMLLDSQRELQKLLDEDAAEERKKAAKA